MKIEHIIHILNNATILELRINLYCNCERLDILRNTKTLCFMHTRKISMSTFSLLYLISVKWKKDNWRSSRVDSIQLIYIIILFLYVITILLHCFTCSDKKRQESNLLFVPKILFIKLLNNLKNFFSLNFGEVCNIFVNIIEFAQSTQWHTHI